MDFDGTGIPQHNPEARRPSATKVTGKGKPPAAGLEDINEMNEMEFDDNLDKDKSITDSEHEYQKPEGIRKASKNQGNP